MEMNICDYPPVPSEESTGWYLYCYTFSPWSLVILVLCLLIQLLFCGLFLYYTSHRDDDIFDNPPNPGIPNICCGAITSKVRRVLPETAWIALGDHLRAIKNSDVGFFSPTIDFTSDFYLQRLTTELTSNRNLIAYCINENFFTWSEYQYFVNMAQYELEIDEALVVHKYLQTQAEAEEAQVGQRSHLFFQQELFLQARVNPGW
jgi:hypothetical protein